MKKKLVNFEELQDMVNEFLDLDDVLHESEVPPEDCDETVLMARRWAVLRSQLREVCK